MQGANRSDGESALRYARQGDLVYATMRDVNVLGIHRVSRAFLPAMREAGKGLLINLTSVAARSVHDGAVSPGPGAG